MYERTNLGGEEKFSAQGRDVSQGRKHVLRSKGNGDVVPCPVKTSVHIASRFHGVAVGHQGAAIPDVSISSGEARSSGKLVRIGERHIMGGIAIETF